MGVGIIADIVVSPTARTQYASAAAEGKFWKEPVCGATSKKSE
jgi:hypothetical protein